MIPLDLKIRLHLPMALPLVAQIREQASRLGPPEHAADVAALLDLFGGRFAKTGVVRVKARDRAAILRATALLRLRQRAEALAGLSDNLLESEPDLARLVGTESEALTCYLFLATLQELILRRQRPLAPVPALIRRQLQRLHRSFLRRRRVTAPPAPRDAAGSWHVVVINDPVNMMTYVTHVLETVVALDRDTATRHMREVHEQKRSIVWTGGPNDADRLAANLRSWHLTAAVEPAFENQPLQRA